MVSTLWCRTSKPSRRSSLRFFPRTRACEATLSLVAWHARFRVRGPKRRRRKLGQRRASKTAQDGDDLRTASARGSGCADRADRRGSHQMDVYKTFEGSLRRWASAVGAHRRWVRCNSFRTMCARVTKDGGGGMRGSQLVHRGAGKRARANCPSVIRAKAIRRRSGSTCRNQRRQIHRRELVGAIGEETRRPSHRDAGVVQFIATAEQERTD
jgi:hypothetical protein